MQIEESLEFLKENAKYLRPNHERVLLEILDEIGAQYKLESFDVLDEVKEQMRVVRNLRRNLEGKDASARELRDLAGASTQLFTMLTKMQGEITNQDRLQKIEEAVVETMKVMDKPTQDLFFKTLEELLP
jgi:hypothetical protein